MTIPLYQHQIEDIAFSLERDRVLNFSDPGTGKTRTTIETLRARCEKGRALVICPKSIMQPAWGDDLEQFAPELTYKIANAKNRAAAFNSPAQIIITNHDAVSWIEEQQKQKHNPILHGFNQLIVDESTAFKNNSGRSKSLIQLKDAFQYRILLSGTPYTNSLTDIWRQAYIADDGKRLGNSFFRFRAQICSGRMLGNGITVWQDKEGMEPIIYHLLNDICIRHKLEDCVDMPENTTQEIYTELNDTHKRIYKTMLNDTLIQLNGNKISAINAAVLRGKLLQITSGAVYHSENKYTITDTSRYELIRDTALARPQSIIAFHWKHQKEQLLKLLPDAQVIDGTTSIEQRNTWVKSFQAGQIPQLLIHPKSGAHGLTLTAGYATIWSSPPPNNSSEEFTQFNRRIYRAGQNKKTETILIIARGTIEETAYAQLQGKLTKMHNFMSLFE